MSAEQGDCTQATRPSPLLESLTERASTPEQQISGPKSRFLGLKVIYSPLVRHKVDIVFVHSIGTSSQSTWAKNGRPELFWPSQFLPFEGDFQFARIMTFDYEFTLRHARQAGLASLADFAEHLLFDLKNAQTPHNTSMNIGKVTCLTH